MKFLEKEIMVLKRKGAASAAHRWMKMLRHGSVALLLGSAAGAASATAYSVTQLPSLGGTYTAAWGIDNAGRVVGEAALPGDVESRAVIWNGGVPTNLGTVGTNFGNNLGTALGG